MVAIQPLVSEFTIIGKLEDWVLKSGDRIKYLQLSTAEGEYWVKVAKEQNNLLTQQLKPGCWLKVTGMRKHDIHKGKVKYKAYRIELLPERVSEKLTPTTSNRATKAKVLFCQESTCWKKGGRLACELLKAELQNRGMSEQVEIKTTGCLKQCKQAPNMVVLPDRVRYSRVQPQQISELIEQHLITD